MAVIKFADCKHADILTQIDAIEVEAQASKSKFKAAWAMVALADGLEKALFERVNEGVEPDQQDLAVLAFLDSGVRSFERQHVVECDTPIDGGEGTMPSAVTGRALSFAVNRWIPRD